MKIVVTGGGGYIGTTLVPHLLEKGHEVTVIDRFFFGSGPLEKCVASSAGKLKLVRDDIRHRFRNRAAIGRLDGASDLLRLATTCCS